VPLIQRKLKDTEEVGTLASNSHAVQNRYGCKSNLAPPVMMFVNRESFDVASRFYSKTFSSLHVDEPHNNSSKENCAALPETYFDFANDILFPDTHNWSRAGLLLYNFMPRFLPEETAKVRNLAVMARDIFGHPNFEEYLSRLLDLFSGVENLFVIIEKPWILEIEKDYTLEESCELEFLNTLIDIPDALAIYDTAVKPEDLKPLLILRDGWIETYDVEFKRLQEWNSGMASHSGSSTSWKVPKIEYKIIMSAGLRRELMRKRHEYHLTLRENRRRHGLSLNSMEDYDELNFSRSELDDEHEGL
jgi:hypothetical protein